MSEQENYKETTDHEEIRNWAEERNVVPARQEGAEDVVFVEEGESDSSSDELSWDEFEEQFEQRDATFRYETEGEVSHYEFVENDSSSGIDDGDSDTDRDVDVDVDTDETTETDVDVDLVVLRRSFANRYRNLYRNTD